MPGLKDLVSVPSNVNQGLSGARNALMLSLLGNPRASYAQDCRPVTNAGWKARIVSGVNVGPFKVTGFDLAVLHHSARGGRFEHKTSHGSQSSEEVESAAVTRSTSSTEVRPSRTRCQP